jgi:hypothetical protein
MADVAQKPTARASQGPLHPRILIVPPRLILTASQITPTGTRCFFLICYPRLRATANFGLLSKPVAKCKPLKLKRNEPGVPEFFFELDLNRGIF